MNLAECGTRTKKYVLITINLSQIPSDSQTSSICAKTLTSGSAVRTAIRTLNPDSQIEGQITYSYLH